MNLNKPHPTNVRIAISQGKRYRVRKIQKEPFGVLRIFLILPLVGFMSTYTHVKTLWR